MTPLLAIRDLTVEFRTRAGPVHAVNGLSLDVEAGEIVGVVGESGCGKTTTTLSVVGLLPPRARVVAGEVWFDGQDLLRLPRRQLQRIRGRSIGMVFQDPQTSLHPAFRVGAQVAEALLAHDRHLARRAALDRAIELLDRVGVPSAAARAREYPHQWSGGMRQRAMIAMAIANSPQLLIADEPTSALDVTIQAQIVDLLLQARSETGAATIVITHNFGLLAQLADRVAVMYGGRVVEIADVSTIFEKPLHPYTVSLLASLPRVDLKGQRLIPIPGQPPDDLDMTGGCCFEPRCWLGAGRPQCQAVPPALQSCGCDDHRCACHFTDEVSVAHRGHGD